MGAEGVSVKGGSSCRDRLGEHNWPGFENHRFHRRLQPGLPAPACSNSYPVVFADRDASSARGRGALDALPPLHPRTPRSPRQRRLRSPQRRARGRLRGGAGRILPPLSPLGAGPAPSPRLSPAGAAAAAGTGEAERSAERSAAGSGARKRGSAEGRKEEEEEKKQEEEEEEQRQEGGSAGRAAPGAPLRARRGSAAAPRSRRDAPAALPQP